jgi:Mn-dependent DtxR family transcriptional regulator
MKIGRNMREVILFMESFGAEHGRSPSSVEMKECLDVANCDIVKALKKLQSYSLVEMVGHGHYVLRRTTDGRCVTYTQHVGLLPH